jgi:hypothetical protein
VGFGRWNVPDESGRVECNGKYRAQLGDEFSDGVRVRRRV